MSGKESLRVLQVTPRFAPHVGGVETHVREVARRLNDLDDVACAVLTGDPSGHLVTDEVIDGVRVHRVQAFPRERDWMFAPELARAIRGDRCDVIHVQSYHTFFAPQAMATAARAGIPYVVTFHGGGNSSALRNRIRASQMRVLGPLLRRAHALVAIAEFEIDTYGRLIGVDRERFVKIPNGADLPPAVHRIESEGRLIVSLGRLERYKGHHRVVAALPDVLARVPDARLWIAGDGPEESNLRQLAGSLGVGDRVEIGATDRVTLAGRLMDASLVVLLSDFESQPLAVLEAASLGVPALVADNSGMAELASQGVADAVQLDRTSAEHAVAIVAAMDRPGHGERPIVPTWDACAEQLQLLYRAVAR